MISISLKTKGKLNISKITEKFNGYGDKNFAEISLELSSIKNVKKEIIPIILHLHRRLNSSWGNFYCINTN